MNLKQGQAVQMCFTNFLSTTCPDDFAKLPTIEFKLTRDLICQPYDHLAVEQLNHPHKWQLSGRNGGCSCHFRHFEPEDGDPLFHPPEDRYPEEEEEVESTRQVYDFFKQLVQAGYELEAIDFWDDPIDYFGSFCEPIETVEVSFKSISRESFRFLAPSRMVFVP